MPTLRTIDCHTHVLTEETIGLLSKEAPKIAPKLTKAHPDRFMGIATLPMQAPERAADELRRAVRTLGMHGSMIGSNIAGKNLDDRSFEPVWAAAAELGAFMLIHPNNVAGADRMR